MRLLPPPGPARSRQLAGLGTLVAILAGLAWYQLQAPAAVHVAASNPTVKTPEMDLHKLPEPVKLAELEAVPEGADVGRNPFSFGTRPAPPPPPAPPVTYTPPPPPPPPVPQGPPPIPLKLTGMLVDPRSGRTMITLRDPSSGTLFQAFEGDVVDGRYRVVKVGVESAIVSYVDGSGTRTLPLGG
jgi:hypothetical protein